MKTDKLYNIIRFYSDGRKSRVQKRNLTIKQAREHCNSDDTSSKTHSKGRNGVKCDWFDGFTAQ